jgi:hypothetical protein
VQDRLFGQKEITGELNRAVFRMEKTRDYAVIAKHHLKNRALSYKTKGLLTFMLCVPEDWDFSLAGLAALASDGIDGVRSGIRELERQGYLTRRRIRDSNGRLGDIEYTIHEIPQSPNGDGADEPLPDGRPHESEEPPSDKPTSDSPQSDCAKTHSTWHCRVCLKDGYLTREPICG